VSCPWTDPRFARYSNMPGNSHLSKRKAKAFCPASDDAPQRVSSSSCALHADDVAIIGRFTLDILSSIVETRCVLNQHLTLGVSRSEAVACAMVGPLHLKPLPAVAVTDKALATLLLS
jgi:hypothetical protein